MVESTWISGFGEVLSAAVAIHHQRIDEMIDLVRQVSVAMSHTAGTD